MSKQRINSYYNKLSQYKRFGGTRNEMSTRRAFANLLEEYCLPKNLLLVDEVPIKNRKRPDGTVKDALQLDWGHWESKDANDNLDEEIHKKFEIGYPKINIIFENSIDIVLYQHGIEVLRGKMADDEILDRVLTAFVEYERPEIQEFHIAIEKFKKDIPDIVEALRAMIAKEAEINKAFQQQREEFLTLCKESINPDISAFDIREMLIQHILTAEIFDTVFGDSHFHRENNIALELEKVVSTFFIGTVRRNTLSSVDSYYKTIKREAANIENIHEKQKFLKIVYENFYKAYNPKGADKLGVVYTPNEIVKFMVESTDYLLEKYFNKSLADKNIQILDPATGTGTFITEIIDYIPPQYLEHKFKNEIHCNEVAILPYYIANLNIEYTYQQKMDNYIPFENMVFVDTLDNLGFDTSFDKQSNMFSLSTENMERIKRQNTNEISVIIGNPPYNANQHSENENNKNREYYNDIANKKGGVDGRIRDTYVKNSTAQKSKVYDMYSRFYRWASDRIKDNGIVAFITNRSFIDSRTFDGFRKSVAEEFDYIYIVDLNGDIRSRSSQAQGNVFGIMTGVAIAFFIKKQNIDLSPKEGTDTNAHIYYTSIFKEGPAKQKLEFLWNHKMQLIPFESIIPDEKSNWLGITNNDYNDNILTISKNNKEEALFKIYSNGISTNRDEWVYDHNIENLINKSKFFIEEYNSEVKRWQQFMANEKYTDIKAESNPVLDNFLHDRNIIKWSKMIKRDKLRKGKLGKFNKEEIVKCHYRPFTTKNLYYGYIAIDLKGKFPEIVINRETNKLICLDMSKKSFSLIASNGIVDLHFTGDSLCLALYRYDKEGNRIDNITDWGLNQFTEHYQNKGISKEDIFYYTYGVLHNPGYRNKYELNLKRDFPRLPFYNDFFKWVNWGKELLDLHIGYEDIEPWDLQRIEAETLKENPKVKLKASVESGEVILDENTTLIGVPAEAWEYKLGTRSAIHWILDQYKEKKPRDKTIAKEFNTYKFADYKEEVIDLIKKVTRVSVRTLEISQEMGSEQNIIKNKTKP